MEFELLMNCVNASLNGELIQFDCPNCGMDVEINGETHDELWENFDGMVTCPLPDGCNSFIKVPSHEELDRGIGNPSPPKPHSGSPLAIRTFRYKDCIVQGQN